MAHQPPTGDPAHRVSDERERARLLAAVMRHQEERAAAAEATRERRGRRTRTRRAVLAIAWMGVAYVWLGSPSWLQVPEPAPRTLAAEATGLRLSVFLQSQRVEAYRRSSGRLPFILQEAGPPLPGVRYRRLDSRSYVLEGGTERIWLHFDSRRPPLDFVGRAGELLTASGGGMGEQ